MRLFSITILKVSLFICILLIQDKVTAQSVSDSVTKTVFAGKQYTRSSFYQKLWGKHYREEWTTPVNVPLFYLDTAAGGLKPYEAGGGRQSKTLRLRNAQGKEYVLRSIDKTLSGALDPIFYNTFIEDVLKDQASMAHPFSAITISDMAQAAKIYHAIPQIVFVPKQPALDSFNTTFGDNLYLFEQRPDENWEEADNFGNSKNIISTEKLLTELLNNNENSVDQIAFVRARLFDIFLGDWGRHEDQWRWATTNHGSKTIYEPIPRDRDQAYTKLEGTLVQFGLSAANVSHLKSFDYKIKDVASFNFPARNIDRRLANEPTRTKWLELAKELQGSLTDEVIESSIKKLPPELFSISGPEIIAKLKTRRDDLPKYALDYYLFLAKEVNVIGTKNREFFEASRQKDGELQVNVYKINNDGERDAKPIYSRLFTKDETKEIRFYGIAGNDVYNFTGSAKDGIKVRVIGGRDKDVIVDSTSGAASKIHVYDSGENTINKTESIKLHLSEDSSIHNYEYNAFKYDDKGLKPKIFYSNEDRLYAGLSYEWEKNKWRREPFAHKHRITANYSLTQKAPSFIYKGLVNNFINKWNLNLFANYDAVRWTNFFGIGNETLETVNDRDFYRMRTREALVSIGLRRLIGKRITFGLTPFFQSVDIIRDEERFIVKNFNDLKELNNSKKYAGAHIDLSYNNVDSDVLPTKGLQISTVATYTQNIKNSDKSFERYVGRLNFYLPILKNLVLAVRSGAATLNGEPEFYQLNSIGGSETLRGFRRDRFWGEKSFYNSNELQYLFNVHTYLFNGKAGIIGLYDQGRVWQKGETSNTLHNAYGGGILLAPFNKIMATITYGVSKQDQVIHLRVSKQF